MSKTIFITGVNSGFGLLTAKTLVQHGHTVTGSMRDIETRNREAAEELEQWASSKEGTLHLVELDVTDEPSIREAFNETLNLVTNVDVLVNNAGIGTGGLTEGFTTDQFEQLLNINVLGVHRLNKIFLPHFRQQEHGRIINISSVMGRIVIPFAALYTASKFALEGYSESLYYELNKVNIDVSIVEPGGFLTGFLDRMVRPEDHEALSGYGSFAEVPEQMWGGMEEQLSTEEAPDPQTVADAVLEIVESKNKPPLRVVVDPLTGGEGPKTLNAASAEIQQQLLENFGMGDLLK